MTVLQGIAGDRGLYAMVTKQALLNIQGHLHKQRVPYV